MTNDRRQSPRVAPPTEIIGTVKATLPAKILNLSTLGMQVEVASTLRPGIDCNVSVPISGGDLKLRARVERCRARTFDNAAAGEGGMLYHAGLSFINLSAEDVEALEEAIVDFSLSETGGGSAGVEDGPIRIQISSEHVNYK